MAPSEYLTQREVADRFRVSRTTVARWRRTGLLPAFRVGKTIRYREQDVERIAAINTGVDDQDGAA